MTEDDFARRIQDMLANDPRVTAMCEQIEVEERDDLARLDTIDRERYTRLRAEGKTHSDAIVWVDLAQQIGSKVEV